MRIAVNGICQEQALALGLDIIDITILDWFFSFSNTGKMEVRVVDGQAFFWVSYQKIVEDLPVLGVGNSRTMAQRFKKLVDSGVLASQTVNSGHGKKSFFHVNEAAYDALFEGKAMSVKTDMDTPPMSFKTDMAMSFQTDMASISKDILDNPLIDKGVPTCPETVETTIPEDVVEVLPLRGDEQAFIDRQYWALLEERFPSVDLHAEFLGMRVWFDENPRNLKTRTGWKKFVTNWLDKAEKKPWMRLGNAAPQGKKKAVGQEYDFTNRSSGEISL